MKLALVHDLAECIVGDIAPADNISKAEKHQREKVLSLFKFSFTLIDMILNLGRYNFSGGHGPYHRPAV